MMKVLLVRYQPEHKEVAVEAGGLWIDNLNTVCIRHDNDDEAVSIIAWLGDDGWHHNDELYTDILIQP